MISFFPRSFWADNQEQSKTIQELFLGMTDRAIEAQTGAANVLKGAKELQGKVLVDELALAKDNPDNPDNPGLIRIRALKQHVNEYVESCEQGLEQSIRWAGMVRQYQSDAAAAITAEFNYNDAHRRLLFDLFKHMSTLLSGAILVYATLIDKLTPKNVIVPQAKSMLVVSVLVCSLLCSIITMVLLTHWGKYFQSSIWFAGAAVLSFLAGIALVPYVLLTS